MRAAEAGCCKPFLNFFCCRGPTRHDWSYLCVGPIIIHLMFPSLLALEGAANCFHRQHQHQEVAPVESKLKETPLRTIGPLGQTGCPEYCDKLTRSNFRPRCPPVQPQHHPIHHPSAVRVRWTHHVAIAGLGARKTGCSGGVTGQCVTSPAIHSPSS
jgi:hypothetical protein